MRKVLNPKNLAQRIAARKKKLEAKLALLPDGEERHEVLAAIREAENALHMEGWLRSAELRPPA